MTEIIKVNGQSHWQNFYDVPWHIYSRDPLWTPLPRESERHMFNPQANPLLGHVHPECFLAMEGKRPVGRIAAITDDLLADKRVGLFGCFESVDRPEVARGLIQAACQSLLQRGKSLVQGPATLNTTQQVGLLVKGFDSPPQSMMPYNPPYYEKLLVENGFSQLLDLYSYLWRPEFTKERHKLKAVANRVSRIPGLQIRPINLNDPWGEGRKLAGILNESMTNQWGYVPMDQQEAAHFLAGLKDYTPPEMVTFCEVENKQVGVCLMMPDLGPQIRAARRSFLMPFLGGGRPASLRVGVLAVVPEYRKRGVVALLIDRAMETIVKKGYRQAELSLIMDTNQNMNSIITSAVGSKVNKTFRVYQKSL